ncbi:MAG: major facilitator superfamily 1 [Firmicutes bacterium]|nr:major facilitator superfamily 1 [Bacillota bacterium]
MAIATQQPVAKPNCGARLDRLPNSRWHWKIYWLIGIDLLFGGMVNSVGGIVQAQLITLGWSNTNLNAVFTSLTMAGFFLGSLFGGIIGDRFGRKNSYKLCLIVHGLACIAAAFAPDMTSLIVLRFIMGIGVGALLVTLFAGLTEYVSASSRGQWSGRISFLGNWAYPLASLLSMVITPMLGVALNWRAMFLIPGIASIFIYLFVNAKFPESPRWLESKGRYLEAETIMSAIEAEVEQQTGKKLEPVITIPAEEAKEKTIPFMHLFKGELLKRVILASFVLIAMNVIQYTLINWLPTIFLKQGVNIKDSVFMNTMSMFGAPFGVFIAAVVVDKISRKVMGVGLLVIMAVLGYIYSLSTDMNTICIIGFFLITVVYMYVCYASAVYVPEIWPTEARLRGSGFANSIGRISAIVTPYGVAALLNSTGVTSVFVMLGTVAVVTAMAIAVLGIDTRKVSVEAIGEKAE